jgi:hypothetical protein
MSFLPSRGTNPNDPTVAQVMGGYLPTLHMPETGMPRELTMLPSQPIERSAVMPYMPGYDAGRFGQPHMGMPPRGPLDGTPFDNSALPGDRQLNAGDLGMPVSMQVDHPSTAANIPVNWSYALLDLEGVPLKDPMDGQLFVLYHRGHRVERGDEDALAAVYEDGIAERHVGMTLPIANAILAQELHPTGPDDVQDVTQVLDEWTFHGVPVTEEGERQSLRGNEQWRSRLVNTTFRGRADAHDVWSALGFNVSPNDRLWIVIKKVDARYEYVLDASGQHRRTFNTGEFGALGVGRTAGETTVTCRPFQMIPWASSTEEAPPVNMLMYEDEFGRPHMGKAIEIGVVRDPPMYAMAAPYGLEPHVNAMHVPVTHKFEMMVQHRP